MNRNHSRRNYVLSRYYTIEIALFVAFLGIGFPTLLSPHYAEASEQVSSASSEEKTVALLVEAMKNKTEAYGQLPLAKAGPGKRTVSVSVSAYSSEEGQCDSTPFITASNKHVRHGIVAANFLPFGTKIRFPDLYGDEIFVVEDRMNARYDKNVDIWMEETAEAWKFGRKTTKIEIY